MKINKIMLVGIMALALAGCSDSNQETDPMELLDAASETTTVSEISETTIVSETETTEAETSETSKVSETSASSETEAVSETTADDEEYWEIEYDFDYAERGADASEEENRLYDFFKENSGLTDLFNRIDESRAELSESSSELLPEFYEIGTEEFFADFDGDGDGELYVFRTVSLYPQSAWGVYQELWYIDDESCVPVCSSTGRGVFAGILEPQDGVPLMYNVPSITMGSAVQPADVYFIKDGKPTLYELPEDESFMYDGDRVFIAVCSDESEYQKFIDALDEARDDPDSFQTLGWVDGELKIISGYGAKNT